MLLGEILGMFLNTLIVKRRYPIEDLENVPLPIQMQLSEKWNTFSQCFVPFLESTSNFKHFEKKMMVIANVFLKLQTVKNFVRTLCKKRGFRTSFDTQHDKMSQILAKFR